MAIREDLIKEVQQQLHKQSEEYPRLNVNQKETDLVISAVFDSIKKLVEEDHELKVVGFGKWEVKNRKERVGTNPQTSEKIIIPAKNKVTFEPSKDFKESVQK